MPLAVVTALPLASAQSFWVLPLVAVALVTTIVAAIVLAPLLARRLGIFEWLARPRVMLGGRLRTRTGSSGD